MNTIYFRAIVICLLLASFLTVQAHLPVARAAVERAAAVGGGCAPHACCCSPEAQQAGKCCCTSKKAHTADHGFHTAPCAADQSEGDTPVVVKFQILLPVRVALVTNDTGTRALEIPSALPVPRESEPPDPPPRLFSNV